MELRWKNDFNPKLDDSNNQNNFDGNIKFNSDYSGGGFKVNFLKAERINNNIEFTLDYESSRDCDYSFFNPPNGDKLMKIVKGGIKKENNISKLVISMDELNKVLSVDSITMKFGFDDKSNWISFNSSQLKPLLDSSNNNTKVVDDGDFVLLKEVDDVDVNKDWTIKFKDSVDEKSLDDSKYLY